MDRGGAIDVRGVEGGGGVTLGDFSVATDKRVCQRAR